MNARQFAVQLLMRVEEAQSFSNLVLDSTLHNSDLTPQDKRFTTTLFYGVLERRITIDFILSKYCTKPLRKLDGSVRNILRIGIYQLLYLTEVPDSAAVNESVKLTRSMKKASASGFVNGVLRSFLRDEKKIPEIKDKLQKQSVTYSVPVALYQKLVKGIGKEQTEAFLENALEPSPRYIRYNPTCCSCEQLEQAMGDKISPTAIAGAYRLNIGDIRNTETYKKGWFYVQDLSSQCCALALGAKAGERVLDLCAAPGGKSCTIAASMGAEGKVFSFDLTENRTGLIAKNAERLHLENITVQVADASVHQTELEGADRVLCDVPCSGYGVLRHKPEIRYKELQKQEDLPKIQLAILENGASYVKVGGILQYSTCTIFPEENDGVVNAFLEKHPEFEEVPLAPELHPALQGSRALILPSIMGSDGFYIAKFCRKK